MKASKYIKVFALITCLSLFSLILFTSCNNEVKETSSFVEKDSSSCITFPKTTWGMTAQEVLKAWDISFSDVEVYPDITLNLSNEILIKVKKDLTLLDEPVKVTFDFSYLFSPGRKADKPIGLTSVQVDFPYQALDKVNKACDENFGQHIISFPYFSGNSLDNLLKESSEKVMDFYIEHIGEDNINTRKNLKGITSIMATQETKEPYPVRVKYVGFDAAMVNATLNNE